MDTFEQTSKILERCQANYDVFKHKTHYDPRVPKWPVITKLTNDEHRLFSDLGYYDGYDTPRPEDWGAYAYSGYSIHELMGEVQALAAGLPYAGRRFRVGCHVPRFGFYKLKWVDEDHNEMGCYYSVDDPNDFVEEEVWIDIHNFYDYCSIGPKKEILKLGMVIEVYRPTYLFDNSGCPEYWRVTWRIVECPE